MSSGSRTQRHLQGGRRCPAPFFELFLDKLANQFIKGIDDKPQRFVLCSWLHSVRRERTVAQTAYSIDQSLFTGANRPHRRAPASCFYFDKLQRRCAASVGKFPFSFLSTMCLLSVSEGRHRHRSTPPQDVARPLIGRILPSLQPQKIKTP